MSTCILQSREITGNNLEYVVVDQDDNTVLAHIRTDGLTPDPDLTGENFDDCGANWKKLALHKLNISLAAIVAARDALAP